MTDNDGSRTKLDAKTWVPIGLAASLLVTALYGTIYVTSYVKDMTTQQVALVESTRETTAAVKDQGQAIQNLSDDMYRVRLDLNAGLMDRWRKTDMTFWVLSAQQAMDRAGLKVQLPPVQTVGNDGTNGQLK